LTVTCWCLCAAKDEELRQLAFVPLVTGRGKEDDNKKRFIFWEVGQLCAHVSLLSYCTLRLLPVQHITVVRQIPAQFMSGSVCSIFSVFLWNQNQTSEASQKCRCCCDQQTASMYKKPSSDTSFTITELLFNEFPNEHSLSL